jgi:hypothetical protein
MDMTDTVEALANVLAEIDAGRLTATPAERAYIAGALESLQRLAR